MIMTVVQLSILSFISILNSMTVVVVVVVVVYDVVLVALVVVRGRLAAAGPEVPGPPPGDGGIVETTGHGLVVRALPAADLAEAWLEFPHAAPRKKKRNVQGKRSSSL